MQGRQGRQGWLATKLSGATEQRGRSQTICGWGRGRQVVVDVAVRLHTWRRVGRMITMARATVLCDGISPFGVCLLGDR